MSVDVAINVYGKPLQTAVALLSLVRHSGRHIGKIFFVQEPKQPADIDLKFLHEVLADKIVIHTSEFWHWCNRTDRSRLSDERYRRSLRYQFAWEESRAEHLFVTHNDVLYSGDLIGDFLENIGDAIAIGEIGQCWNCPASIAERCDGDRYWDFRPTQHEVLELYQKYPTNRVGWEMFVRPEAAWPLPECRVNEWSALIDLRKARPHTVPIGGATPFGALGLDVGTDWFREMSMKGFRFENRAIEPLAKHGWAIDEAGHPALFSYDKYESGEATAFAMLAREFNIDERVLSKASGRKWKTRLRTFVRSRLRR